MLSNRKWQWLICVGFLWVGLQIAVGCSNRVPMQTNVVEEKLAEHLSIDELTEENRVIAFVKEYGELPDCYITKQEARAGGWVASEGNLCDVLPGKVIGGDSFGNREKKLPVGNKYFEADVNYHCGRRQADRIVYTADGEVWLTKNHYKTFEKK